MARGSIPKMTVSFTDHANFGGSKEHDEIRVFFADTAYLDDGWMVHIPSCYPAMVKPDIR